MTFPDAPSESFQRHLRLDGAVNFRDIGGYRTTDGHQVREGVVFRADGLSRLSDADLEKIRSLHIATVVDLRSQFEVDGGRFPVDDIPVTFHHVPLLADIANRDRFKMVPGMLAAEYREMASDAAVGIAGVLKIISERDSHPVIVHCTAGKDRTGVLVAVLLAILGVEEETIIADYAKSAPAMAALRLKLIERYPEGRELIEESDEMFSATPSNMADLLAFLRTRHGSVIDYATKAGLTNEQVEALRTALLV